MKIKKKWWIILVLVLGFAFLFKFMQPPLLVKDEVQTCIHEPFVYEQYLHSHYQNQEVKIEGQVNIDEVGQYSIVYQVNDKKDTLIVNVVDLLAPEFDVIEKTIVEGESIEAKDLVENVNDDSEIEILYENDYNFSTAGDYPVQIIVKDIYGNQTVKESIVHVEVKDTIPPVLTGLSSLTLDVGRPINLYEGVSIVDNLDPEPTFTIDTSNLKENVAGIYTVYYLAEDRQGNKATYSREVILRSVSNKEKVVYLTIDDGPSFNTPEVLSILEKYNAKATFFVTGECPEYYPYIKMAHDQGHTIGLHTFSHNYSQIYASDEAYIADLKAIQDVVAGQIGYRPTIFRFPGGSSNTVSKHYNLGIVSRLADYANRNGFVYYDWNADIGDGNPGMEAKDLIEQAKLTGQGLDTIVMLMHDGRGSQESVKALPEIIEYYQALGYTFKAIDECTPTAHHRIAN